MTNLYLCEISMHGAVSQGATGSQPFHSKDVSTLPGCIHRVLRFTSRYRSETLMVRARFGGYRVWKKGSSQLERIMVEIKKQNIRDFGRPDVPSVVKAAMKNYATDHKIPLKTALNVLITEVGSYKELLKKLRGEAALIREKHKRQREVASTKNELPRGAIYKKIQIVVGGAPGLGHVRKPMRVKSK